MRLIDESTPVATTVHEVQVMNEVPQERHDVRVTCIVTPSRVIETRGGRSQPKGIFWEEVTPEMIRDIPLLGELMSFKRGEAGITSSQDRAKRHRKKLEMGGKAPFASSL